MREIKFRGLNDYGWHVGHLLISYKDRAYIVTDMIDDDYANVKRSQEVELSTVGQYTGQYDPTATEFCEGDVIKDHTDCWEIKFFDGAFLIVAIGGNAEPELLCGNDYMEIIGNRFENPELLEAKE